MIKLCGVFRTVPPNGRIWACRLPWGLGDASLRKGEVQVSPVAWMGAGWVVLPVRIPCICLYSAAYVQTGGVCSRAPAVHPRPLT